MPGTDNLPHDNTDPTAGVAATEVVPGGVTPEQPPMDDASGGPDVGANADADEGGAGGDTGI